MKNISYKFHYYNIQRLYDKEAALKVNQSVAWQLSKFLAGVGKLRGDEKIVGDKK